MIKSLSATQDVALFGSRKKKSPPSLTTSVGAKKDLKLRAERIPYLSFRQVAFEW